MKINELNAFKKGSKINIEGVILKTLALAGLVSVAVFAPNALRLLKYLDRGKKRSKKPKNVLNEALRRLELKKLVFVTKDGMYQLTKEGERQLYFIEHGTFPLPNIKWDKKWRIVSFDVNEKRKRSREKLRMLLRHVGFVRLQDSVWVYPFDVEEVVTLIKTGNFLEKEVLYITAYTTGNDAVLKSRFKLK